MMAFSTLLKGNNHSALQLFYKVIPYQAGNIRNELNFEDALPSTEVPPDYDLKLHQVWSGNAWNLDLIKKSCPTFTVQWLNQKGLSLVDEPDILARKVTTSGAFSISSTMDILDPGTCTMFSRKMI
ncbi:hypothetical protein ACH5RR_040910 [Cinchona calisaya]|uniref:Uncharacterized protein n=1 Tax=Cinchona calisaya TaxID=153742 RepID=A0ABD2XT61_9GENT